MTRTTPAMTPLGWSSATSPLLHVHPAVVAHHDAERTRSRLATDHLDLLADERVLDPGDVDDPAPLEDHRVLDLGVHDLAVAVDRRERADEAADEPRAAPDDRRPPDVRPLHLGARLHHHPTVELAALVDETVDARLDALEEETVGLEQRRELPGVDPPAGEPRRADTM